VSKISTANLVSITPLLDKMKEKTKGRSNRTIVVLIAAWLVMMAVLVACNSGSSQPTQVPSSATALPAETPALDGATLLETRCSVCHSADRPRQAKKTHEQWEQTVTRMIGKGAQLTEAEKTVLVDYLAKTYGP
jgi:cytochrome c5